MKKIIAHCDPYNSRMHYNGQTVVEKDGVTPIAWVVGEYATVAEAQSALWEMALEDESRHFANLSHEDDESIASMKQMLAEDEGLTSEELDKMFSWYEGEGVYYRDSNESMYLKGDTSYSYDVMTYTIE